GNCGPGTLVTIRLKSRVEKFRRDAWARIVGGAKFCAPEMTSAPSACFDSFSPSMALETNRSRLSGSEMYTGSGPRITTMRLPPPSRSASVRTDTGTSARTSTPSVRPPREIRKERRAPATTASTTSLTVPPNAFFGLEIGQLARDSHEAPVRADGNVERRFRGGVQPRPDDLADALGRFPRPRESPLGVCERIHGPLRQGDPRSQRPRESRGEQVRGARFGVGLPGASRGGQRRGIG